MRGNFKIMDCDRHIFEPDDIWERYLDPSFRHYNLGARRASLAGVRLGVVDTFNNRQPAGHKGNRPSWAGFSQFPGWREKFKQALSRRFDNVAYLHDMDVEGVDVAFLFPTGGLYFCWQDDLDPDLSAAMCRAYNNWLHEYCAINPERLRGICLIPLQSVELAVQELTRAYRDLGMRGVFWRPNPLLGRMVSDPSYQPLFACAEELGIGICFHEGAETILPQFGRGRVDTLFARHALCHPTEQMGAFLALASDGTLDKFSRLRVAFLEAGCGWLPYWVERLDALYDNPFFREGYRGIEKPSGYFRRGQCYVSCEAGEETIPMLEQALGQDTLMWASDYPHPDVILSFPETVRPLIDNPALSDQFKRRVLWDNPTRFYGLIDANSPPPATLPESLRAPRARRANT